MELIKRYRIFHESELLFAKRDMHTFLKEQSIIDQDFFIFALMELGTNLLKHAAGGEIWLLKNENFLLAALDKGPGIKNIEWAKQKGTSTYQGSLGLGLSQLNQNDTYSLDIFTHKDFGTAILLHQEQAQEVYFTLPLIDNFNGDFFAKKGKYYLFGDASGHGIKAYKSTKFIQTFFFNTTFSCLFIDDFFKELHTKIQQQYLRGAVLSIVEVTKKYIYLCGVGNIEFFVHNRHHSFKDGVVGVAFSSSQKYRFERPVNFFIKSDGVNIPFHLIKDLPSPQLAAIVALFYSKANDDRSIFIIKDL